MGTINRKFVNQKVTLVLLAILPILIGLFVLWLSPLAAISPAPVSEKILTANTPLKATATTKATATNTKTLIHDEKASNDNDHLYYSYAITGDYSWYRVYIDSDQNPATGFPQIGIGAEFLLEGPNLFRYSGIGGSWGWTLLTAVPFNNASGSVSWIISRSDIGETDNSNGANLVFQVEPPIISSIAFNHNYSDGGMILPLPTRTNTPVLSTSTSNIPSSPTRTVGPTATNTPLGPTPTPGPAGSTTITYTENTSVITNPERGPDHTNTDCQSILYTVAQLQGYHATDNMNLVLCNFYLNNFKTSAIDSATLTALQNQLNTIRSAGFKVVLRFAYTKTDNVDATRTQVLAHINQLAPIIQANSDVIALWQGSFIGEWGEAYYTANFGDMGVISPQQWADRKAVYDAQLAALPSTRMISLRTPLMMTTMYGSTPVSAGTAFNGSAVSRIGQINDAFLASPDDWGTYSDTATQYPWLQEQTTYTVMGGETGGSNSPRTDCTTALQEMAMFHWSYINVDWYGPVVDGWKNQGCWDTMQKKLGYRFVLTQGTYPNQASAGGSFNVRLSIRNDGFAAPYNPRTREIILRNNSTGALYRFSLTSDPRFWLAGTTTNISQTFTLPADIPAGSYALMLNLSDPASALSANPQYSIQLANIGTWESGAGFNNLLHSVTIP